MLCLLLGPRNEVLKINQHDVNEVMEAMCHGVLEGGSRILEAKGHDSVGECAPWGCEYHFAMVFHP